MLDALGDRSRYFSMWNQAVDSYDPDVRIIENHGVEDELPNYCFPLNGQGISNSYQGVKTDNGTDWSQNNTNVSSNNEISIGNVFAMEINLAANLWRSFLYSNVALYLPDSYKITKPPPFQLHGFPV